MNPNSVACSKTELDLFCLPPTQVAIEEASWIPVNTVEVSNSYSIKFEYTTSEGYYLDLARSYISFQAQIDGTSQTLNKAGPINMWGHSLFKQIDLSINDKILTSANDFYPYEAMVSTLLSYGKEAARTQLALAGYEKDTAGHMDANTLDGDNEGLEKRSEGFNTGQWRDFVMRPFIPMFQQERLLPPSTKIRLNLVPSDAKFCLMLNSDTGAYKPKIKDSILYLRIVKINSTLALDHAKKRVEEGLKLLYPIRRLETTPITLPRGLQKCSEKISSGQLPKRMFVLMVSEAAQAGAFKKNPFNFQHFNLTDIHLKIGAKTFPSTPLSPDFPKGLVRESYMTLFSQTGILFDDKGLDISLSDYQKGYTIFCFDLTADNSDGDHLELVKRGDIQLNAKFAGALTESVTIINIAEFENTIQIDQHNGVMVDYMS